MINSTSMLCGKCSECVGKWLKWEITGVGEITCVRVLVSGSQWFSEDSEAVC